MRSTGHHIALHQIVIRLHQRYIILRTIIDDIIHNLVVIRALKEQSSPRATSRVICVIEYIVTDDDVV